LEERDREAETLEKEIRRAKRRIKQLEERKRELNTLLGRLISADVCPFCLQPITLEHKYKATERVASVTSNLDSRLAEYRAKVDLLTAKHLELGNQKGLG
jgi:DNA repair exonuclease SbcCD ATPase subunit